MELVTGTAWMLRERPLPNSDWVSAMFYIANTVQRSVMRTTDPLSFKKDDQFLVASGYVLKAKIPLALSTPPLTYKAYGSDNHILSLLVALQPLLV